MKLQERVSRLEQARPPELRQWQEMISPRDDMTEEERDAFIAAELSARGLPAGTPVIFRRIVTPEGVAAIRERERAAQGAPEHTQ